MVGVASVIDVEDDDPVVVLVDSIPDPVLPPAGPPHALERSPQRHADGVRSRQQRPGDELPGGEGCRWGQPVGEGASGGWGQDQVVGVVVTGHGAAA